MKLLKLTAVFLSLFFTLTMAHAADYYVVVNGQQQGPFSMEQMKKMKTDGTLTKESMVWKNQMASWEKAGQQKELQPLFAAPAPPPLPASKSTKPPPSSSTTDNGKSTNKTANQADINEQNRMSDPKAVKEAADTIADWSDSVLDQFGIPGFGENNGKYILFASQQTMLKPVDPQYGDSLVNAFDKVMMKIQENYLMDRFGDIAVDKVKQFYSDRSTDAKNISLPRPDEPDFLGKLNLILDKGLKVTSKKLDQQLLELGVDPAELKGMIPKKKKNLFKDRFVKNTIKKASGSIAGLFPIQTKVVRDSQARTVIGVVAVVSPKTIQIAEDIRLQRKSVIKGKGRDVKELIPASKSEFMATLGVRLIYDEQGRPGIISYGLSSYRPDTGDDYINAELRSDAKTAAVSTADAQIAEIVNGYMNVKNERKTGEEINKYVEREMKAGSATNEKMVKNIIKISNKNAKSSASARLQGISTVERWRYTAKSGHKFVGAVRVWKYGTLQAAKKFNKTKFSKKSESKGEKKKTDDFSGFEKSSKKINTMDDF